MDFRILGPFDVRDPDGRVIRLPSGRERSLLALLLIHRDEVVSGDMIVDALWGAQPPLTAAKAVQGYVSHLRRVLEPDAGRGIASTLLLTQGAGYRLRVEPADVDAGRFDQLARDVRRALDDGSPAEAAALAEQALALWRGPALAEFMFDDFAQAEIRWLDEQRLAVIEDRGDSLLLLDRHVELAGELDALVATHPLRERLRSQLMLALYRSGRQTDALHAYRDGRRHLAELGLEPGPELQRLERSILAHDPALETPTPNTPQPPAEASGDLPSPTPAPRRRTRLVVGVAAVVLAGAAALAFVLGRDDTAPAVTVSAPAVVAVDPATNKVVASIQAGSKPVSIAAGAGGIWVGDAKDGTVVRIDPVTRHVIKTIGIAAPAVDLAAGAGSIWAATGGFGTVVRIDPRLDAAPAQFPLGDPSDPVVPTVSAVAVAAGRVWAGALGGLVRVDPKTGTIDGNVIDLGRASALGIAARGGVLWATTLRRRAKRVDASSGEVTAEFYAGAFAIAVALDRSAVWIGGGDDGELWKLDPVTGSTVLTARAGKGASAIALGEGGVWVASWRDNALVRVDPGSGAVVATIPVGGPPEDVVVANGLVWVAVQRATSKPQP